MATRILLVEPDAAQAYDLGRALEQEGWGVTSARSVMEAIRLAGETRFDAAVLDFDLPDGTGLDLLDFLRVGSPGIRILMLSSGGGEAMALQALSHGAGDILVKGRHLEAELPRRTRALLDGVSPVAALVETLRPTISPYDDLRSDAEAVRPLRAAVDDAAARLVEGPLLAVGVFDPHGRPVAWECANDLDADGLGFALATLHAQVGALHTFAALRPTGYEMLVPVEGGLLAITAIPGTFVVGMLMARQVPPERALERLRKGARELMEALDE